MYSHNRDISWLRTGVVDRGILLDTKFQRGVGIGCGSVIFSNILPIDNMFGDMEGKGHIADFAD